MHTNISCFLLLSALNYPRHWECEIHIVAECIININIMFFRQKADTEDDGSSEESLGQPLISNVDSDLTI